MAMTKNSLPESRVYYLDPAAYPSPSDDPFVASATPPTIALRPAAVPLPLALQLFSSFSQTRIEAQDFAAAAVLLTAAGPSADAAVSHAEVAQALRGQGRLQEAEALLRQGLLQLRGELGETHPRALRLQSELGSLLRASGSFTEARRLLLSSIEGQRRLLGVAHEDTANSLEALGQLLGDLGEFEHAEPLLQEVVVMRRRQLGEEHPDSLRALHHLGRVLGQQGRLQQAELILQQVEQQQRMCQGAGHPDSLATQGSLADVLSRQGRLDEAEHLYRQCLGLRRRALGRAHRDTLQAQSALAGLLSQQDRVAEAAPMLEEAVRLAEQGGDPGSYFTARLQARYGAVLVALRQFAVAEAPLLAGYQKLREVLGQLHPRTQAACSGLIALYRAWGKPEKAAPYRAAAASCS